MTNKLYTFLDDRKWLKEQLMIKSMASLAAELSEKTGIPKANLAACIRFRVYAWYTEKEREFFVKDRKFHKNKPKSKV